MLFHSIPVHLTCFCYLNFSDTGLNIAFFALYGLLRIVCFCRCLFDVKSTWYTGNPMSSFAFRHCYQCKFHGCLWHNKNDFSEEAKHRTSLGKSTEVLHRKYGGLCQRSPMFSFSGMGCFDARLLSEMSDKSVDVFKTFTATKVTEEQ